MTAEMKQIDPLALASITTGVALCEFGKVHEALEWIVGHPVWTHEIPAALPDARSAVLRQFPDMPITRDEGWQEIARTVRGRYGDGVETARGSAVRTKDPLTTAVEAFGREPAHDR